jgi:hypothetical protein
VTTLAGRCRPSNWLAAALLLAALLCAGCGESRSVDDTYGRRRGTPGQASVNGTAVLARMFEDAGHWVVNVRRLSPRLERVDVIVWFPDRFQPPSDEACAFLDHWLAQDMQRVLVYVGRDYDAAEAYWQAILPDASPQQALEIRRRLALTRSIQDAACREIPEDYDGSWFTVRGVDAPRTVHTLQGPWSRRIDAAKANIQLRSQWVLPEQTTVPEEIEDYLDTVSATPLLESDGDLLVGQVRRSRRGGGQAIVVANGSFLLNLPLVNHEHRKLAGRLIEQCGAEGQRVAFLESGPGPVAISDRDREMHHVLRAFTEWPMNCILMHLTVLGIVYCFCHFPLFGRARGLPPDPPSDFAKHIDAVGGHLERTADLAFAHSRVSQYLQTVRGDLGTSPFKPPESRDRAGSDRTPSRPGQPQPNPPQKEGLASDEP